MTRGVQHLLHLDFMSAAAFNRMSFVVLPLLVYLWLKEIWRVSSFLKKAHSEQTSTQDSKK